jgi:hypothetical protein
MTLTPDATSPEEVREQVRTRYAAAAQAVTTGRAACCGPAPATTSAGTCCTSANPYGAGGYDAADRDALPADAVAASLGCGNPLAVADLNKGDTVLDLGSDGGIDVLLSGRRVGPTGKAYGLDMTDEMLDLARRNAAQAGASNVEFLKGQIEAIPLPDDAVEAACVAGALSITEYRAGLEAAGFASIEIIPTHQVADGMHSAIIKATEPTA